MTEDTPNRRGKVERLIDEYGLEGVGAELVDSWTAAGEDRRSLRDLARYFNRQLLRRRLDRADVSSVAVDEETVFRRLRGEETSPGVRTRMRGQLEREGVDVDSLEADFVSHTAVRTFLRHRGASRPDTATDRVAAEAGHIQRLRSRTATVTEDKLEQLRTTGRIDVGEFRVLVDVQIFCEECQTQFDVNELLEARQCSCE